MREAIRGVIRGHPVPDEGGHQRRHSRRPSRQFDVLSEERAVRVEGVNRATILLKRRDLAHVFEAATSLRRGQDEPGRWLAEAETATRRHAAAAAAAAAAALAALSAAAAAAR
jgi:hypothetical protein